jgi:hypothetical protein
MVIEVCDPATTGKRERFGDLASTWLRRERLASFCIPGKRRGAGTGFDGSPRRRGSTISDPTRTTAHIVLSYGRARPNPCPVAKML